jgi:hypothetical protein
MRGGASPTRRLPKASGNRLSVELIYDLCLLSHSSSCSKLLWVHWVHTLTGGGGRGRAIKRCWGRSWSWLSQGFDSSSLSSQAGRYDNPIPNFLAPRDCSKIPAQVNEPPKWAALLARASDSWRYRYFLRDYRDSGSEKNSKQRVLNPHFLFSNRSHTSRFTDLVPRQLAVRLSVLTKNCNGI